MKLSGGQAAGGERRDERARAWHRLDAQARRARGTHDAFAGIADAGTARVGDEGDAVAAPEPFEDFLAAAGFVEGEATDQRLADPEVLQQLAGAPGVFGGDDVALAQDTQRAQRDV